ncbi:AraC family transcriptional regulator [Nonomuraea sp. SMC257]|uniref:AraC family transcriptional regulator n=1 Tax=Nonomuraea montanisoli TaxID=2741721 RepID=A0A7Y6M2K8_9ACTN|nr:AraC family transcriptional regulator [Nonomuraea montanisoli]NUW31606.1 AraC family transcriptional regulator [Nonomuraea montanisoli]
MTGEGRPAREWTSYWRSAELPLEAMYASFLRHRYHRHSHETYSFGVTEHGAQTFTCRGAGHTSAAGMVMAFNPDEVHDGHAAHELGFTYRIVHIGRELLADVLADRAGHAVGLPLFAAPVLDSPVLATRLRRLHTALSRGAAPLERDEALSSAVAALAGLAARTPAAPPAAVRTPALTRLAARARELIHDRYADPISADDLATWTGGSRYAVYRAFRTAYGLAPSEYQRQVRLRAARRLLALGHPAARVAGEVGFTDQAHLTRWFGRSYGVTPTQYRLARAG